MATELYKSGESAYVSSQLKQIEQHGGFFTNLSSVDERFQIL